MSRAAVDICGNVYGRLTVVSREGLYRAKSGLNSTPTWLCICSCGTKTVKRGDELKKGSTRSCGCLLIESAKRAGSSRKVTDDHKNEIKKKNYEKLKFRLNKQTKELDDHYILQLLIRSTDLNRSDINKELIELKRNALAMRRAVRKANILLKEFK